MARSNRKRKKKPSVGVTELKAIRPKVAGIDIGSTEHWVCGPAREDGQANVEVFGAMTAELNRMADWLCSQGVESVAMESTSVYWIPLFELLESRGIEVVLANARQVHNVPGRKTDYADCQWIQLLHSCGLLRGSFRPTEDITRMRALQRQVGNLVGERTRCVQWMQKALDQMNVQVHRAVSDLTGVTGLAIVRAIVAGERDPLRLAAHRDKRCRHSVEEIAQYLTGNWREEHVFNLASALRLFDMVEQEIATYETKLQELIERLHPPSRVQQPVPPHPNASKDKAMKTRAFSQPGLRYGDSPASTSLASMASVLRRLKSSSPKSGPAWTCFLPNTILFPGFVSLLESPFPEANP